MNIIFDGDDTLWITGKFYTEAKEAVFDIIQSRVKVDRAAISSTMQEIDFLNVKESGFGKNRFAKSLRETYNYFVGGNAVESELRTITKTADKVFHITNYKLYPDTLEVLNKAKVHNRIFLLTAGDREIQASKIKAFGFWDMFDGVGIVDRKDGASFKAFLDTYSLDPNETWMVGNSLKSDIEPALPCGLQAVWLDTDSWFYDNQVNLEGLKVNTGSSLTEAMSIIEGINVQK